MGIQHWGALLFGALLGYIVARMGLLSKFGV